nr:hypothetical protein [Tanacetum cinerariifolium]
MDQGASFSSQIRAAPLSEKGKSISLIDEVGTFETLIAHRRGDLVKVTNTTVRQLKRVNRTYFTVAPEMKNSQASGGVGKREAIKNLSPLGL